MRSDLLSIAQACDETVSRGLLQMDDMALS